MKPFSLPQLAQLETLRGNPVIFYAINIGDDSVSFLYECLRKIGPTERLDLVLSTAGGSVTAARQIALLLREYTKYLTILVPHRARSAGTLLCLSANELVLGPMTELGPIDTHMNSAGQPPPNMPGMISAEDIHVFRQMAEEWFGVQREEDRLHVLAMVAEHIFPPTLSSFYRFDRLTRQAASELLCYQLPDAEPEARQQIVDTLVGGYNAHDHVINRTEARSLGLHVRFASAEEETLMWNLLKALRRQLLQHLSQPYEEGPIGVIMSTHLCARLMQHWINVPQSNGGALHDGGMATQPDKIPDVQWEIEGE